MFRVDKKTTRLVTEQQATIASLEKQLAEQKQVNVTHEQRLSVLEQQLTRLSIEGVAVAPVGDLPSTSPEKVPPPSLVPAPPMAPQRRSLVPPPPSSVPPPPSLVPPPPSLVPPPPMPPSPSTAEPASADKTPTAFKVPPAGIEEIFDATHGAPYYVRLSDGAVAWELNELLN